MNAEIVLDENPFEGSLNNLNHETIVFNKIQSMLEFAMSTVVDNEGAYKKITSLYSQAREWKKCLEAKRKELTEPFRKQINIINDTAKKLSDPLDYIIDQANDKANGYVRMLEDLKKKSDEDLRAAASLFDEELDLYIPPLEATIRGDGAIAITKTEKHFRITDITKVPTKYLMVDEKAIKQAIKLGITEIPGLEIYEEKTTQLRKR